MSKKLLDIEIIPGFTATEVLTFRQMERENNYLDFDKNIMNGYSSAILPAATDCETDGPELYTVADDSFSTFGANYVYMCHRQCWSDFAGRRIKLPFMFKGLPINDCSGYPRPHGFCLDPDYGNGLGAWVPGYGC